jgi:hypothetical protein
MDPTFTTSEMNTKCTISYSCKHRRRNLQHFSKSNTKSQVRNMFTFMKSDLSEMLLTFYTKSFPAQLKCLVISFHYFDSCHFLSIFIMFTDTSFRIGQSVVCSYTIYNFTFSTLNISLIWTYFVIFINCKWVFTR